MWPASQALFGVHYACEGPVTPDADHRAGNLYLPAHLCCAEVPGRRSDAIGGETKAGRGDTSRSARGDDEAWGSSSHGGFGPKVTQMASG